MFNTELAACQSIDTELFFPDTFLEPYVEKTLRKLCMECPIWNDCYTYALHNKVSGYWAGTSDAERKRIRKQQGIQAKPIFDSYKQTLQSNTPEAIYKRQQRESN